MIDVLSKSFFHTLAGSATLKTLASSYGMRHPTSFARRFIAGETIAGRFLGLDPEANLRILLLCGQERLVAHHHIAQLKEVGW